jgi:NADH-quinone oxidoreductase subunit L
MSNIIWLIPLAPLIGMLIGVLICLSRRGSEQAHLPTILGLAVSAATALYLLATLPGGSELTIAQGFTWLSIGRLEIPVIARLDGIGLAQLNVVTFISLLVAIYARGYMHGDPGYPRFFAIISGFVFSMVMLVLAGNLLVLYAFWECVGLCSYLLIGYWYQRPSAASAATKAFLVNRLADCGFLAGILLLWYGIGKLETVSGSSTVARLNFDTIFSSLPGLASQQPDLLTWAGFLLFVGAIGKSAQFPFHVWLPDAMEGPTPVSALIHAATMVTAGVYLLARMSPLLAYLPNVLILAGWLGAITAVLGGLIALFQDDLKRVLAYSTVSQLGYLFLAFGAGVNESVLPLAVVAAMFHLITHAFFKALLFLTAGNVMHAMGDVIDMRRFGGLRHVLPVTHVLFLIGALALVGVPPLAGFWSKEGILGLLMTQLNDPQYGTTFTIWLIMGLFAAFTTAIYTFRAYFRTFLGNKVVPEEAGHHAHEAGAGMLAPLYVLAVGSVLTGLILFLTGSLEGLMLPLRYLEQDVVHQHAGWLLIAISVVLAAAGAAIAAWTTIWAKKGSVQSSPQSSPLAGLAKAGANRFYLDEIFYYALVLPVQKLGDAIAFFDLNFIDGFFRWITKFPENLARVFRNSQSGLVSNYALSMVFGVVVLLLLSFLRS